MVRFVSWVTSLFSQAHVDANPYFSKYAGSGVSTFQNWLVFEVIGVAVGGFISGLLSGRLKFKTEHGPNVTSKIRWIYAFAGGIGSKLKSVN